MRRNLLKALVFIVGAVCAAAPLALAAGNMTESTMTPTPSSSTPASALSLPTMAWTPAVVELVNWDTQTIKLYLEDGKILTLAIPTGQSADWRNGDHVEVWLQKTQESAPQVTMRNAAGQTVLRIPVIVEVQEHAAKTVTVRDMDGQPVSVTMQAEKPANWQGGEYAEVWIRKASETR